MIVGVLGGGQLGRMLALAGYPLGLRFRFFEPVPDPPVDPMAEVWQNDYEDRHALADFAAGLDLVTYEFESVPAAAARWLAERRLPVFPPPLALETAQERWLEKSLFQRLGIPTPPCAPADSAQHLQSALAEIGMPAVVKTRRFGYDGKGQAVVRNRADADRLWEQMNRVPLIVEGHVAFDRELSLLAIRGRGGAVAFYPLIENHHRDGILRLSRAPAPGLTADLQRQAEEYGRRLLDALEYVGVLAVEFFQVGDRLLANEMAPRVHNSGHWTIEGAETSQFENHLRALLALPLGSTAAVGCSAMVNLIGTLPAQETVLAVPGAHLHLYGKQPRPGRKLGHITIRTQDERLLEEQLIRLNRETGLP